MSKSLANSSVKDAPGSLLLVLPKKDTAVSGSNSITRQRVRKLNNSMCTYELCAGIFFPAWHIGGGNQCWQRCQLLKVDVCPASLKKAVAVARQTFHSNQKLSLDSSPSIVHGNGFRILNTYTSSLSIP